MGDDRVLLAAAEAAARLGVKPETLYAYVSRGLLARHRRGSGRASWFDPAEVDRLAARGRRDPNRPQREVRIESAVTAIEGGRYFYRGQDAVALAGRAGFEQVAELLWTGTLPTEAPPWIADPAAVRVARAVQRGLPADVLPFDRIRLVTAALATRDPFRHDLRRDAVLTATRQLLATLVESLPGRRPASVRGESRRFAARLWDRLATRAPSATEIDVLDATLVLLADHELAASTFAVRIAAALRADPYGAIGAGLGVLGGVLHGAVSVAAEALLGELRREDSVATVIDRQLRRNEKLPGIGHPLYPDGDPRAKALLALVRRVATDRRRLRDVDGFLAATRARGLPPPNVDLGIAALTHTAGLAAGSGELVFALARMVGWIAHALEEYERPSTLRPRAVYTGVRPAASSGSSP